MAGDISDLLQPDLVVHGLAVASRKALFAQAGALTADALGVDAREVAEALTECERGGTSGFGGGVAVADARVAGLDRSVAIVLRLVQPIAYAAVDGVRVDLVAILLSPIHSGADHLKALSRLARRLRDDAFVANLRGAGSRDALFAILVAEDERDAV